MRQVWFVTLAYYIFTILILFLDEYRLTLGFMLRVKHYLIVKKKLRQALMAAGLVLCLLMFLHRTLLFPFCRQRQKDISETQRQNLCHYAYCVLCCPFSLSLAHPFLIE